MPTPFISGRVEASPRTPPHPERIVCFATQRVPVPKTKRPAVGLTEPSVRTRPKQARSVDRGGGLSAGKSWMNGLNRREPAYTVTDTRKLADHHGVRPESPDVTAPSCVCYGLHIKE